MTDNMIHTEGLTKHFKEVRAVEDLSLSIPAGEVFGLLGPNGAGKTTTIRMLTALISPTKGTAQVAGYTVGQQDTALRQHVGILTETPGMYEQLSAERNLGFFRRTVRSRGYPWSGRALSAHAGIVGPPP